MKEKKSKMQVATFVLSVVAILVSLIALRIDVFAYNVAKKSLDIANTSLEVATKSFNVATKSLEVTTYFSETANDISKDSAPLKYEYEDISMERTPIGNDMEFAIEEGTNYYLLPIISIELEIETGQIEAMYIVYKKSQEEPFSFELINETKIINSRSSPYLIRENISIVSERINPEKEEKDVPCSGYAYLLVKNINGKIYIDTIQAVGVSRIQTVGKDGIGKMHMNDNDIDTYSFRVVQNNELVALSGSDSTKIKWIKEAKRKIVDLDEVEIDWNKVECDINQIMSYYMKFEWQNITPN